MKKLLFAALSAGALLSTVSAASAQYYGDRPQYRERYYDYDGPRYYRGYGRRACPRGYGWLDGYGCIPQCYPGYTWQSGACKPFRGY
jgi:opacity protein-like surface antigen